MVRQRRPYKYHRNRSSSAITWHDIKMIMVSIISLGIIAIFLVFYGALSSYVYKNFHTQIAPKKVIRIVNKEKLNQF